MKIWVLGRGVPKVSNNMLGSFEFEQAQMLAAHGNEVWYPVVDIWFHGKTGRIGLHMQEIGGVHVATLYVPFGRLVPPGKQRGFKFRCLKRLFRMLAEKTGKPEILHVHYPTAYPCYLFEWLQGQGVGIVGTEHWTKVQNKELLPSQLKNLKDCVRHYDALLCVGEPLRRSILEQTGTERKITVLPNIVSDEFSFAPGEKKDDVFRFVGIGRLVPVKCFDLMIRAFCDAFPDEKAVRLDIVGGGEEKEKLEKLIETLGCGDRVSLLGVKNRRDVAAFYHQCSALAVASNLETFGVPIIEAMASGLPVVTTDAMGFPGLFRKEHGLIVPANDQAAFSAAMRTLYEQYDSYDPAAIAAYAKAQFSEEVICTRLCSIYVEVLERRQRK